jgi:hypothetical protein
MYIGLTEDLARERVADHERTVRRLRLEREALACQRDYQGAVRKVPAPRLEPWLEGWRFVFGRRFAPK